MKNSRIKGRISKHDGQLKVSVEKIDGGQSLESKGKVQKVVGNPRAVYGDLKRDLQRLWVIF